MESGELLNQSSIVIDGAGKRKYVRAFFVDGLPPNAATGDPIVPPIGSPHPTYSGAVVDAHEVSEFGDGRSSLVRVLYSTDGSYQGPPTIDPRDGSFRPFSATFQIVRTPIPFLYEYELSVPGVQNPKTVWGIQSLEIEETIGIYSVQFPLNYFDGAVSSVLRNQNNKLHLIDGKYYRFSVGNVTPIERDLWTYEYSWHGDDGTIKIQGPGGNLPPQDKTWQSKLYTRPPFSALVAVPDKTDPTVKPTFDAILQYEKDDNGFHSLPGYPFF